MPFQNEQFGQSDEEKDQPERLNQTVLTSFHASLSGLKTRLNRWFSSKIGIVALQIAPAACKCCDMITLRSGNNKNPEMQGTETHDRHRRLSLAGRNNKNPEMQGTET